MNLFNDSTVVFSFVLVFFSVLLRTSTVDGTGATFGPIDYAEYINVLEEADVEFMDSQNGSPLIVGGVETNIDEYLFTVGLRDERDGRNFCGGALIDRRHVITAAHCVESSMLPWIMSPKWVSLGSHYLKGEEDGQQLPVLRRIQHPDYNRRRGMHNDFAILELAWWANEDIPTIPLSRADPSNEGVGKPVTVAGWGTTSSSGSQSPVKLAVTVPIVSHQECERNVSGIDPNSMLCAGGEEGKDSCQGDSGGPLFSVEEDGSPVLVGIVSWGIGCARKHLPGVYAKVSSALDFIQEHANPTILN